MPYHKNTCCRGHEIKIFGKPFLGHHYYKLSYSDLWSGAEKKTLKKFINFTLSQNYVPLKWWGTLGHKNYNLISPSPKGSTTKWPTV